MILDSIRAEVLKFSRDRKLLYCSFLSVPFGYLIIRLLMLIYTRLAFPVDFGSVDVIKNLNHAFGVGQNFFAQLLFLSGAVGMLTQEYRLETWRHIVPRNRRSALLGAKLLVLTITLMFCILLVGGASIFFDVAEALAFHYPVPDSSAFAISIPRIAISFLGSVLILMTWGAMTALVATVTRSQLATMIVITAMILIEPIVASRIARGPVYPLASFVFPSVAANELMWWSQNLEQIEIPVENLCFGVIALALWIAVFSFSASLIFSRQDLARE